MASLPAVFVELRANASSFTAAMKSAQNELKKTADVGQSNMDRMANDGKVAFAGIAAAAVGFGAVAVKAALDGQQAHAQLVQAVQNSGTAFSSVGGAVDEMSGRFAKLGFENDQVEAALTRMVTASGSTKIAMDNMGLAADLARARHISLEEASNSLGKVLAGNMKGMTAFGLSAKDASGNVLTTAQAIAELNDRFGGAAQANANTYAGKLQALNAEWHNMIEQVGNLLLPVLANLAGDLANVAGWFEKHQQVALGLAAIIGGPLVLAMSAFIAKQVVAFAASTIDTVKKLGAAIMTVLVPATETEAAALTTAAVAESILTFGLAAAAGVAAYAAVNAVSHASATKDTGEAATGAASAIEGLTGAETGLGSVTDGTTAQLKAQADLFKQLNGDTDAQSSEILKLIGDQQNLNRATTTLNSTTKNQAQNQKDATAAAANLATAQAKVNTATDAYNKLLAGVGQQLSKDHTTLHHNLTQAQLNNEEAQQKVNDAVAQYGADSFEARQANLDLESSYIALQDAQEAMGHEGESAWAAVDGAQQKVVDAQAGVVDALDKQKTAIENLKAPSADVAANTLAWQQAQATLNTDWGKFQDLLVAHPELRDQLVTQIKHMKDNLPKGADTKPLQDLLDKINGMDAGKLAALDVALIIGATNKDIGNILAPLGAGAPPAGQPGGAHPGGGWSSEITFSGGAAEGAVVKARPGGHLMVVGEGGSDEAIVPLDRAGLGGGTTIVVNVAGSVVAERELALVVRDELIKMGRNTVGVGLG